MLKTSPVLFSYLFLSIAFGILMQETGVSALWAVLASLLVYTGAFQFVLVSFISSGARSSDGSVDSVGDQQSSYFLWGKLCGNISGNEKAVSIYDFFIDR